MATKPIALSAQAMRGKEIYLNKAMPSCGVCHSLADAGSTGAVGPNLNTLQPNADQVLQAVTQGVGVMPAFGEQLNQEEIAALVAYVTQSSH